MMAISPFVPEPSVSERWERVRKKRRKGSEIQPEASIVRAEARKRQL